MRPSNSHPEITQNESIEIEIPHEADTATLQTPIQYTPSPTPTPTTETTIVTAPNDPASPDSSQRSSGYFNQITTGDINSAAALRAQYAIDIPKSTRRRNKRLTRKPKESPLISSSMDGQSANTPSAQKLSRITRLNTTNTDVEDNDDSDRPLVDTTASLTLHSKKTSRAERKQQKRTTRLLHQQAQTTTLLSLPSEILLEILTHLPPSTIYTLLSTSRTLNSLITAHLAPLSKAIIHRFYWTLCRCLPLPFPLSCVPQSAHQALLSPRRQEMLNIHRKPYQHVQMVKPTEVCTCLTCVFAWNNLCMVVDLHHWQKGLEAREPIPIIPRGRSPEWNEELVAKNAEIVRKAMMSVVTEWKVSNDGNEDEVKDEDSDDMERREKVERQEGAMIYARILEMHLDTIVRTITRNARSKPRGKTSVPFGSVHHYADAMFAAAGGVTGISTNSSSTLIHQPQHCVTTATVASSNSGVSSTVNPSLPSKTYLYNLSQSDIDAGTDAFLERKGPPSYEFPYMRDRYYDLVAYVPNRKWDGETGRWYYYGLPPVQHDRDLEWVKNWAVGIEGSGPKGSR